VTVFVTQPKTTLTTILQTLTPLPLSTMTAYLLLEPFNAVRLPAVAQKN